MCVSQSCSYTLFRRREFRLNEFASSAMTFNAACEETDQQTSLIGSFLSIVELLFLIRQEYPTEAIRRHHEKVIENEDAACAVHKKVKTEVFTECIKNMFKKQMQMHYLELFCARKTTKLLESHLKMYHFMDDQTSVVLGNEETSLLMRHQNSLHREERALKIIEKLQKELRRFVHLELTKQITYLNAKKKKKTSFAWLIKVEL